MDGIPCKEKHPVVAFLDSMVSSFAIKWWNTFYNFDVDKKKKKPEHEVWKQETTKTPESKQSLAEKQSFHSGTHSYIIKQCRTGLNKYTELNWNE